MKTVLALRIISCVQIALYGLVMLIIYYTSHDGKDDFGGILAIFPLIIFILLGVPSTILWMVHIVKVINKEVLKVDTVALILALVVIGLSLVYLPLTQWIG